MYGVKLLVVLNIFLVNLVNSDLDLQKGSECMTSENILGDCKSYKNCTVITLGLKSKKIKPENITFCKKQFLEVCCPRKVNLTTPKPLDIQSERISERKCRENSNYTLKTQFLVGLIGQEPRVLKLNNCKHNSVPLIVGGSVAQTSEFPHQALLGYVEKTEVKWKCGGSIISSDFILTAAHCTRNVTFIKVGMHSRLTDGPNTATYRVKSIIIHPSYKSLLNNEDIALIQLQKNIKFNEYVFPICLPTKQIDHQRALVTGFGNLGNGFYSENLMKVVVEKFEYNECKNLYDPKPIFRDTMLCYGDKSNSKDSCDGDSGGPLQVSNENNVNCTYTQIGIVSFGSSQCGLKGFPAVYVNVFNYIDWIERNVWPQK